MDTMQSPLPSHVAGDSAELLPLVYDELRRLAGTRMARESGEQTLQPTALVHEAWLRLARPDAPRWNDRAHFFRAAALAMRRILVDRARGKARARRGDDPERVPLDESHLGAAAPDKRVLMVDDALEMLERDDPALARLVTLKFFGGFTNAEIAEATGLTERTVERQWAYARACLLALMSPPSTPGRT